jgi:hypothetical protein
MPARLQIRRHRPAHDAQPDKSNFCHDLFHFFINSQLWFISVPLARDF